jgi:hypothetical protein
MQSEDRLRYYDTKRFPWYDLMTRMCGGRMTTGDGHTSIFNSENTTTVNTENSMPRSATDSSDGPPDEVLGDIEMEDTVQQQVPYKTDNVTTHTSEGGISASCSSGSRKRKST